MSEQPQPLRVVLFPYSKESENPYLDQLAAELETLGVSIDALSYRVFFLPFFLRSPRPKVLHLQWLHAFLSRTSLAKSLLSTLLFLTQLLGLKLLGVKIVWTAHNLKNHENRFNRLDRFGTASTAKLADAVIAHCTAAKTAIATYFSLSNPGKIHAIPHANYIPCYQNTLPRRAARAQLKLSDTQRVVLFLGLIRPYKGVAELIDAFEQVAVSDIYSDARLLIAGKLWREDVAFTSLIQHKVEGSGQIDLIAGFIPDDQLQLYFNACDVVVFPYKDILTSGAVMLALSFGKACIAPRLGCIQETLDDTGSFLYDPDEVDGLLKSIQLAIAPSADLSAMGRHNFQLAEQYSGEKVAKMTKNVYQL